MKRLVVLLALVAFSAGCGGSGSPGGEENGPVAFIVGSGSGQGISVRDADGHRRRLTRNAHDIYPTWSPDGTKIAFERVFGKEGGSHLFVMDADGTNLHRIGPAVLVTASGGPSWMPDGKEIVFDDATGAISAIGVDGSGLRRIAAKGFNPSVSPDGKEIVFRRPPMIFVMNADGSGAHLLIRLPNSGKHFYTDGAPSWSHDGKHVVFVRTDIYEIIKPNARAIEVVNPDGSGERVIARLSFTEAEVVRPSWSPDGESLVFAGQVGERNGLWTVSSAGGKPKLVLEGIKYGQPSWGPART